MTDMRRSTERTLVLVLLTVTGAYAVAEEVSLTTLYPTPREIYDQLRSLGQTTLAEQGGNVGINTDDPKEALQIGDRFTVYSGHDKAISYNYHFIPGTGHTRLVNDRVAQLRFTGEGKILIHTAPSGLAGSVIPYNADPELILQTYNFVGIGTELPLQKLDVNGNVLVGAGASPDIHFGDAGCGTSFSGIIFAGLPVDCPNYALLGSATDTFINRPASGTLHFREDNDDQMVIESGGNVGIGVSNPLGRLHVRSSGAASANKSALYVNNSTGAGRITGTAAYATGTFDNRGVSASADGGTQNTALMIPGAGPSLDLTDGIDWAIISYSNAPSYFAGNFRVRADDLELAGGLYTYNPNDATVQRAMIWGGAFTTKEPEGDPCPIPVGTDCKQPNPLTTANGGCSCPTGYTPYLMGKFEGSPGNNSNRCLYGCYR